MEYRNFQLKILFRIFIIFLTLLLLVLALTGKENYVTAVVCTFLLIVELIELFNFINRINREIEQFITALRNEDYSLNFNPGRTGRTFRSLRISLGKVMHDIGKARKKELMQVQYLQMLFDHIDSGLMLFDADMKIRMQNRSISMLFTQQIDLNYLNKHHHDLADFVKYGNPGERELYSADLNDKRLQFTLRKSVFRLGSEEYHLVSLQDIHSELDNKELDSWYKLIKVLTHEIMNSVTPVNSLSGAIREELKMINDRDPHADLDDVILSAQTIYERSRDLMKFISDYKKLTKSLHPEFKTIDAEKLLIELAKLFEQEFIKKGIDFKLSMTRGVNEIYADKEMIMRVLINLINNSVDALRNTALKKLNIIVNISGSSNLIIVEDNGEGISPEIIDDIFVPFFTTRERGSGVGLPLCRQIMQLHKGSINIQSKPGEGTKVSLVFP